MNYRLTVVLLCCLTGLGGWVLAGPPAPADRSAASATTTAALATPDPGAIEHFERRIRPLLDRYCYECHAGQSEVLQAGLRLDDRQHLLDGGDSGPAIVPGDPDASLLIQSIRYQGDGYDMPPEGKMPDHEIELLVQWVAAGAAMPVSEDQAAVRSGGIDWDQARDYWAFQPLQNGAPPAMPAASAAVFDDPTGDQAVVLGPIDAFVVAAAAKRQLTPSPPAPPAVLIRRLAFALTGLPPSQAEVERFLQDPSPLAYQHAVDRLLESPAFGEHWGRHWLDLARYTDTTESWLRSTANAYLYRDWVVDALNRDLPYDRFVRLQLAADAIDDAPLSDLPALGFLGLSPTYFKELLLAPEVIRGLVADELEERADAVGRTFLGLTIACARCHDHKFDPISQADYYALAGVFASTRQTDRPLIDDQLYAPVAAAKAEISQLTEQIVKLRKTKPLPEEAIRDLEGRIQQLQATPHFDTPLANVVVDETLTVESAGDDPQAGSRLVYLPQPIDLPIAIRGNPNRPGELVPRQFLTAFSTAPPRPLNHGSGRIDLANALFDEAAPLTARVIVNRIWAAHLGRGLVETTSNFGEQGSRPSHPELLEYLASGLVRNGWSLKWLHREIVLSATFRQSSDHHAGHFAIDPDNRWLWRTSRRRLAIEPWRDAMLVASGELQRQTGGPAIAADDPAHVRRTLYTRIHRRDVARLLQLHDFPDPNLHSPGRMDTTTPLQGLFILNSPFMTQRAAALARRLLADPALNDRQRIDQAYRRLFGRSPSEAELNVAVRYLNQTLADQPNAGQANADQVDHQADRQAVWQAYAHALLGSNELLFLD